MPETPDVREQLAAYLAGELNAAETAALEARMGSEPWVAQAADDMADMLARIGRVDDVDPPAGFSQRLRASLAEEIGHELPVVGGVDPAVVRASGAAAADGWSSGPTARADSRRPAQRHAKRQRFSRAVMGVAAAVAVLFVGTTAVFLGGGLTSGSEDTADSAEVAESSTRDMGVSEFAAEEAPAAAEDAASAMAADVAEEMDQAAALEDATLADPAAPQDAVAADAVGEDAGTDEATDDEPAADDESAGVAAAEPSAGSSMAGPDAVTLGELDSDEAIRVEVGRRGAAEALLGRSADEGDDLADPYRDEILRAAPFPDGTQPGACLLDVLQDADGVVVPAVAAQFTQGGEARLGYALVRSSDDATLDTIDVWVADPDGCAVVAVVS